jgi:Mrp family chromosome partitioning ATPase
MPNITIVEQPTDAVKTLDDKTKKLVLGLAAGGLVLGLGLAFLMELVFNRKIERPIEIQARLQLPLLLTIPFIRKSDRARQALPVRGAEQARIGDGSDQWAPVKGEDQLATSATAARHAHFILPFSETIRDRIVFNFEINNVIHKPKLIAVTAMSEGAGTSTIAAGLAKSFSEIKNSKVLLVDLSSLQPAENSIFGEASRHSLPGALRLAQASDFREGSQNLYYANASSRREEGGPAQFTPLHLHEMMPLMHASEYDYIIFDMPAIAQTSPTLTMAGLMDKVLLVLDAENTTREGLKWGYSELTRGRADVSCIFNKTRTRGPEWLIGGH